MFMRFVPDSFGAFAMRRLLGHDLPVSLVAALSILASTLAADDKPKKDNDKLEAEEADLGEHGFADSDGVKIHYVTSGQGPLIVLIHGFPDYWYSWRAQMPELASRFQPVAIDMRGYNESDKPEGVENYTMEKLVGDAVAVVKHFGRDRAIIVGHDWGGMVAWNFAMGHPQMTERLIILNLPHPRGLLRELKNNPDQQKSSQLAHTFARTFQKPDTAKQTLAPMLATWVKDPEAAKKYVAAFRRSSLEGMLNCYKANYPREPYDDATVQNLPQVKCPVLMFHGLKDPALLPGASTTPGNGSTTN